MLWCRVFEKKRRSTSEAAVICFSNLFQFVCLVGGWVVCFFGCLFLWLFVSLVVCFFGCLFVDNVMLKDLNNNKYNLEINFLNFLSTTQHLLKFSVSVHLF